MKYMRKYYDYRFWPFQLLEDVIKYLCADERQKKIYKYVPCYCQQCDLLGICRDENNNWKCRRGCMTMSNSKRYKK